MLFRSFRERVNADQHRLPRSPDDHKLAILKERLGLLAASVRHKGASIVLVDDIPMACTPNINYSHFILRLGQFDKCSVPESVSLEDRKGMSRLYKSLATLQPKIFKYFDPHSALCYGKICNVFDRRNTGHHRILYGDGIGHFRPEYPNPLKQEWASFLKKQLANHTD